MAEPTRIYDDCPRWAGVLVPADLRAEMCELAAIAQALEPEVRRFAERAAAADLRCGHVLLAAKMPDEAYEAHRLVSGFGGFYDGIAELGVAIAALDGLLALP